MTPSAAASSGLPEQRLSASGTALRWIGFALGIFALINIAGELTRGPFDTLRSWIAVPLLPPALVALLQIAGAMVLIACSANPISSPAKWPHTIILF
jgi:hypothetical protein